jgi:hypothetical protein
VCLVRGFVPGRCEKWGVVKNGGLGVGLFVGGGRKNRHTQMVSRQPKKWEADEHAIGRW